jgi:hypothetical protein
MAEASQSSASEQLSPDEAASNMEGDGSRTPVPMVDGVCTILLLVEVVLGKRTLTLAPRWHRIITKLRRNRHPRVKPRTTQSGPKMESRIV